MTNFEWLPSRNVLVCKHTGKVVFMITYSSALYKVKQWGKQGWVEHGYYDTEEHARDFILNIKNWNEVII